MKILVVSLYFNPDHTGIANYANGFATAANKHGHDVQVITGFSFYPHWKKRREDKFTLFRTENTGGIKVLRNYLYVPQKPNTLKRILQEISFLFFATLGLLRVKKPDLIVCFTTPILLGFWSSIVAKIFGSRLLINVQDFQLEAALSLGMAKPTTFTNVLEKIEKTSYRKANYVSSITNSMCDILLGKKEIPAAKILLWPNWINMRDYDLSNIRRGSFREKHQITDDEMVLCYAGNIGLKQGLEVLVEIAGRVRSKRNVLFLIIGNGAALEPLKKAVHEKGIDNIRFLSLLSPEEYLHLLKDIDIFILPQRKTNFDVYFPSKLMGVLVCRVPLLLLADNNSELYKTVKSKQVGTCFEFNDVVRATDFVIDFCPNDPSIVEKVDSGVIFANEFDEERVINRILKITHNEN